MGIFFVIGSLWGAAPAEKQLHVRQPEGKVVYWVLPGPRRLDPAVFGTPAHPAYPGNEVFARAKGPLRELLQKLPILVGLPERARGVSEDGKRYTATRMPTPFGDAGRIVQGFLDLTYVDRQPEDLPGNPMNTKDEVRLTLHFTDPQGHVYDVHLKHVFMPPIPGYETGGGVLLDSFHHGNTGTGSPLMPRVYTYGAFWGVADLVMDGKVVDQNKVLHCMTTNTVRDRNYRLAFEEELPLPPENTIAGQIHHTHCILLPVNLTPEGPRYAPVHTGFILPNGKPQPFLHIMFEQDEIVRATGFHPPASVEAQARRYEASRGASGRTLLLQAREFAFSPQRIQARPGEVLRIRFENQGHLAHNLTFPALGVATPTLPPGKTAGLTVTLPSDPRAFPVFFQCSVPGHKEAGMQGTIVLSP